MVQLQKKGKLFQGKLFSLLVSSQAKTEPSRFGFIISSKVHKGAVKRNRARRLLIEAIKTLLPQIKPGFDTVFLAKKTVIGVKSEEIRKETKKLFQEAGLLK
jgi:ribonuclease P protein component